MPYIFFSSMTKVLRNESPPTKTDTTQKDITEKEIAKPVVESPRKSFRKIKSEEDFVKFQVPWIL